MRYKHHLPLAIATMAIITAQVICTRMLIYEQRRNYSAEVVETFKACTNTWNPWEKSPWDR